jgi:hypothetical protein
MNCVHASIGDVGLMHNVYLAVVFVSVVALVFTSLVALARVMG